MVKKQNIHKVILINIDYTERNTTTEKNGTGNNSSVKFYLKKLAELGQSVKIP